MDRRSKRRRRKPRPSSPGCAVICWRDVTDPAMFAACGCQSQGAGKRGLGIPNIVDRVVQQALLQVMEPIFEPTFHPSSHGFRPRRGAHTAIAEATGYLKDGYQ